MSLPEFLIIGTAKAGTSSLYHYLSQHPALFTAALKELNYFAYKDQTPKFTGPQDALSLTKNNLITDWTSYQAAFAGADPNQLRGESSVTTYLYVPGTAERIKAQNPNVRLIAVLRNPVDRAYSAFMHLRRDEREPHTHFDTALAEEPARIAAGWSPIWHYQRMGFYGEQLARYLEVFPREQLHIILYEDIKRDVQAVLRGIYAFLDVDTSFQANVDTKLNSSGLPRHPVYRFLYRLVRYPHPLKQVIKPVKELIPIETRDRLRFRTYSKIAEIGYTKPALSDDMRETIMSMFRDDILHTQDLIDRDLSAWLKDHSIV